VYVYLSVCGTRTKELRVKEKEEERLRAREKEEERHRAREKEEERETHTSICAVLAENILAREWHTRTRESVLSHM